MGLVVRQTIAAASAPTAATAGGVGAGGVHESVDAPCDEGEYDEEDDDDDGYGDVFLNHGCGVMRFVRLFACVFFM